MVDINVNNGIVARTIERGDQYTVQMSEYNPDIPEQCAVLFMLAYTINTTDEDIFYVPEGTFVLLEDLEFKSWMDNSKYERSSARGTYNVWESAIAGVKDLIKNKDIRNSRALYFREAEEGDTDIFVKTLLLPDGTKRQKNYVMFQSKNPDILAAQKLREKTIAAFQRRSKS